MELIFIGIALIVFGLTLKKVLSYPGNGEPVTSIKNCNKGHSWEEIDVGNDLVTLKCKVCKKSLGQILNDY